jgi:hypothetical protein
MPQFWTHSQHLPVKILMSPKLSVEQYMYINLLLSNVQCIVDKANSDAHYHSTIRYYEVKHSVKLQTWICRIMRHEIST